jgi:hypothetical protein
MFTKMKIALVIAGSLVTGVAAAQGTGGGAARPDFKAKREAFKAEMLQKFDTNRDGKLDDGERAAARDQMLTKRFEKLDTDRNGQISLAEFKAGKSQMRHGRMGRGMHRGFKHHGDRGGDIK